MTIGIVKLARSNVREEMVRGAAELLATRGVHGTSFTDVLAHTAAPRGSIYHHFPGGKNELVQAAAASTGDGVTALLNSIDLRSPGEVIDAFIDGWRSVLVAGRYEQGCAVAATCLGSSGADDLRTLSGDIFSAWQEALARALVRSGSTERHSNELAAVCLAAVEGALVIGRAAHDDAIFDVVKRQLRRLATP